MLRIISEQQKLHGFSKNMFRTLRTIENMNNDECIVLKTFTVLGTVRITVPV